MLKIMLVILTLGNNYLYFMVCSVFFPYGGKTMNKIKTISIILVVVLFVSSCSWNNMAKGGTIGAGIGGVVGGLIGYQAGNTAAGAIVGAAVGGTTGALIGHYMDKQAAEIKRDLKNAKVERVGEGIKITFQSGILFDVNSSVLRQTAKSNITDLARILQKYEDTNILVEGHTDSDGSAEYNLNLSKNRANSVYNQLQFQNVSNSRIQAVGYGEEQPVADNSTKLGRQKNRRVEIAIFANEKLKRAARKGVI